MNTICLMADTLYDLTAELEKFILENDVIHVVYRIYSEFCVAEVQYK